MDRSISRRELLKRTALGALAFGAAPPLLMRRGLLGAEAAAAAEPAGPWSFGVMGDTQWTCPRDPAGRNPNTVAVSIIDQINREFIKARVKFVIQVGDLTNNGRDESVARRADAARALHKAGIGFFPMRGNHETFSGGRNGFGVAAFQRSFPQTRGRRDVFGAENFSSPTDVSAELDGMSYSFDYGPAGATARFVIIDNWATPKCVGEGATGLYGYTVAEQQEWISGRLARPAGNARHQFVLSHQSLIGASHQDCVFSGYTDEVPKVQNAFFAGLQKNGVPLYISGHDHIHYRTRITSPDGRSAVEQLICASNSSKFYTPQPPDDPDWYGQKAREKLISQQTRVIGYYIFTVNGPRITVDYYADDHAHWRSGIDYPDPDLPNQVTPPFRFAKKETWRYGPAAQSLLDRILTRQLQTATA